MLRSRQAGAIVSVVGGGDAIGWVAACDVGAKWKGEAHAGERVVDMDKAKEVEEYARGALGADELTVVLFKGLWHALEPGRGFMSVDVSSW